LEDGELEREVAVAEQTAAVRPLRFDGFGSMAMIVVTVVMMIMRPLGEPSRSGQSRQEDERGEEDFFGIHCFESG
jgi:hypothetical protein